MLFQLGDRNEVTDLNLTVTCKNPNFKETFIILTTSSNFISLIQTDKSVYKPEDLLRFRILVLDKNKIPFNYDSLNVKIFDAENLEVFGIQGDDSELVLEGSFTIPKNVRFGNWTIKVIVDDNYNLATQQAFEVKEYVLPFIEVFIDTKKFITSNDPDIVLDISAKYTFDDYVRGKVKITAQVIDSKYPDKVIKNAPFHVKDVKTQKRLVMNLKNDLNIMTVLRDVHVKIEAEFEDEVTGKKAKATETVIIANKDDFRIYVKKPSPKFNPGIPYELEVFVLNPDGTTMETNAKIVFNIKTHHTLPRCTEKGVTAGAIKTFAFSSFKYLRSGKTALLLNPFSNATAIEIEIKHFETTKKFNIVGLLTESREYLYAKVATKL